MMFVCFFIFFSLFLRGMFWAEQVMDILFKCYLWAFLLPSCQGEVHNESIYFSFERAGTFFCTVKEKHYRGYR